MIVVASTDSLFANQASSFIKKELGCDCTVANFLDASENLNTAMLVITDTEEWAATLSVPVIPIKKPCYLPDLLIKIDRQLQTPTQEKPVSLGKTYEFFVQSRTLVHASNHKSTMLTDKEAALILQLHQAGKAGIEPEKLLETVWGIEQDVPTRTLQTHLYRLRTKIKTLGEEKSGVELIQGKYRLIYA